MFKIFKSLFTGTNDDQLTEELKDGAFLVDVRSPMEFSSGSAKDAINIPLNRIPSQLTTFKNKKHIIVFCASGARSSQAKSTLERHGLKNVINGGTWQQVNKWKNGL